MALLPNHMWQLLRMLTLVLAATPFVACQSQWVDWVDETGSRLQLSVVTVGDNQEKDITSGDVDNDGDDDIVIVRKVPFSVIGGLNNVLLMNEGGVLVDRTGLLIPGFLVADDSRDVLLFDANNDGWKDLVIATTFQEQPRLFMNQGNDALGTFQGFTEQIGWFSPIFSPGPQFCAVYDGDVDNDGDRDLYFSDYNSLLEDRLLINDGTGQFTDETTTRFPTGINNSVFGTASFICDMNMDGWNDIIKCSGSFEPLKLLINDGTGHFTQMQTLPSITVYMMRTADFDNDGRLDMYVVSDGQDYLLMNTATNGNGTINVTQISVSGSSLTSGFGGNVKVADLDRDGYLDVGVADVDVDIPGCVRRFAALRNTMGQTGVMGFTDPNSPSTQQWNSQGTHDLAWIDLDGDGFMDLFQGRCSGYRMFMMDPFAAAETYGSGCAGTNGIPFIGTTTLPALGNAAFAVTLDNGWAGAVPLLVFGSARAEFGISGCDVLIDLPLVFGPPAPMINLIGKSQIGFPIPNDPALEGVRAFMQWAIPDPAGQLGGLFSLSDALEVHLSANSF